MGSFLILVLIIVIVLCIKDNKHQSEYIAAVKARKKGEPVTSSD